MDIEKLKKDDKSTPDHCEKCDKPSKECTCDKSKEAPQGEQASVNSLGKIPSGGLRKKKPLLRRTEALLQSGPKSTRAGAILAQMAEMDGSPYDAKIEVDSFDANKLPELKNAIIAKLGSTITVAYNTEENCFYLDGGPDEVAAVKQILIDLGAKIKGEGDGKDKKDGEPGSDGGDNTDKGNPFAGGGDGEPVADAPAGKGEAKDDDESEEQPLSDADQDMLKNGRLNDIVDRIMTKVNRMPSSKRAHMLSSFMAKVMQSVQDKAGASQAMLVVAKEFLKSEF